MAQTVKNPPAMQETGFNPGSGRSLEGGNGNPLQYSGLENSMYCLVHGISKSQTQLSDFHFTSFYISSLIAQLVKNLPAMQETLVGFLGWEDPLEKRKATHFSILGLPLWFRQ